MSRDLPSITRTLVAELTPLVFGPPVAYVYNPLEYARAPHERYLELYGQAARETLLIGMNPGPFGMAQTGVPFGDVEMVRDWMRVEGPVGKPPREHPKRPVLGFNCPRREVSGARLWGWARDRFGAPTQFFARFFVINYCPLCFLEESGRNLTPDNLPPTIKALLFDSCDRALRQILTVLQPQTIIGVGAFAETRAKAAANGLPIHVGRIPHPSPANPAANRGWALAAERGLRNCGIKLP